MAKKNKNEQPNMQMQQSQQFVPGFSFKIMNNNAPVPVAKPADFIQLTPIVQPMSIVPYSSQSQPLAQFDDEDNY